MFKNYLKFALRSLLNKTTYSIINIIGLTAGLVCVLFIFNWVYDELTYDRHFPDAESLYRVAAEAGTGEDRWFQTVTSLPLGSTVESTFPEVDQFARLDYNDAIVEYGEDRYFEDDIVLTDPDFFNLFGYQLIKGNKETALSGPYQIVLTESMANKYFGKEDPIGRSLKMFMYDPGGTGADYEITGVVEDPPEKSHFSFAILGSLSTIASVDEEAMSEWGNNSYYTYIKLTPGTDPSELESKFPKMVDTHIGEMIDEYDLYYRFFLQPVTTIHLRSNLQYEIQANGNMQYVFIFSSIGILILCLAIINYVNLTTSFSFERAKEVGVRKVMGALKNQLMSQHLTETIVLSLISIVLALISIKALEPLFYSITNKYHINFGVPELLIQLLALGIPIGVIAGFFPARILSRLTILSSLKGQPVIRNRTSVRSLLVAFQFGVTAIILIGVVVVHQQLQFVQSTDLGYDKENLMVLRVNGNEEVKDGYQPFKDELLSHPDISFVTRSGSRLATGLGNSNGKVTNENGDVQFEKLYRLTVGYDYLSTYKIELVAGRNIDPRIHSDSLESFILNEKAVSSYGWTPEEAIDKELGFNGREGKIIGVVKDFHFNTLHHEIEPVCIYIRQNFSRISIKSSNIESTNQFIADAWNEHFPSALLDYSYQDQALMDTYENDKRFGQIFNIFSVLSMLIALLGLFGLVGFSVQKKTKEIGIRKVLGASTIQILGQISMSFLRLIGIAALFAFPVAWYGMNTWLSSFPYRIGLEPMVFALAFAILLGFAVVVILVQSLKSSLANPAETLKDE